MFGMVVHALAEHQPTQPDLAYARKIFQQADRVGRMLDQAPAFPIYRDQALLGYLAHTTSFHPIPGYSGKPIDILFGLDPGANIIGLTLFHHEEPILVAGITESQLAGHIAQYDGLNAFEQVRVNAHRREGVRSVDGVSGATITTLIINRTVMASARALSAQLGLPRLDLPPPVGHVGGEIGQTSDESQHRVSQLPEHWFENIGHIIFTGMMLALLMAMLFVQDILVRRPRVFRLLRTSFLLFTLLYLGGYHLAQLSIVNILGFFNVLIGGFKWDTLLLDPIVFLLWSFIAISILLWGRGVFCGWLCPFGALQDLLSSLAQKLRIPQLEIPPLVHERLWAIKYFILILLAGAALESITLAARIAEVEPFKTVFVLRFDREWYFVLFALLLIVATLFNSKFYCKYLCPLGAALSFGSHFRVFDWLRRHAECGHPCQACASRCQIGAIKPTGEIIDTECHHCLECQVLYWDENRCPPLVAKASRRTRTRPAVNPTAPEPDIQILAVPTPRHYEERSQ
jgi:polyferredoxin/Na+-translocating ferredoxin:NAD+ oxidoreductase RnfG subunit